MVAFAPTACKHRVSGTLSLPSRGSFHLSLTVLYAIGHQVVFSLGGWAPRLPTGLLVSCGTLDPCCLKLISTTGLLPSLVGSSKPLRLYAASILQVLTPFVRRQSVWALSRSLAATKKIDVSFFSSGYLDVSVHRVPLVTLCIHVTIPTCGAFPHSDIHGYNACLQLPMAFRSLPRPSSALGAKASTLCSF